MKLFVFFILINFSFVIKAQPSQVAATNETLFAQGMFKIEKALIPEAELALRKNSNIKLVRLDSYSGRFFILTQNISNLSNQELISWFEENGANLTCLQIGVYGVDTLNEFPFINCNQ